MTIPTLTTPRLTLRGPKGSDATPLGAFLASPRAEWIGGPWPAEEASDWLSWSVEQWARQGHGTWIVALRDSDSPIGRVGLLDHEGLSEPELGWFLFEGFDGHGLAHEAALAARDYCYDVLGLPPLFSLIEPANLRSRALAERLGAKPEGEVELHGLRLTVYRHPAEVRT